jgi:hypothetical protein
MTNRFPVIANSDIRRLEELAEGDNLNLSGSGIYDGSGVGIEGQQLYSTGSGVEWKDQPTEYDTLYSISAEDGASGKKIIRLTSGGPLASAGNITDDITLVAGDNITLDRNGDEITINSSYIDTDTITRVRGNISGTYVNGDITLLPQGSTFITQSGNNITIGSTDTNTITRIKGGASGNLVFGDLTFLGTNGTSITQSGNTISVDSFDTITRLKASSFIGEYLTGDVTFTGGGATTITQNDTDISITSINTTYGLNVANINESTKAIRLTGSNNTDFDVNLISGAGISLSTDSNNITISADTSNLFLDDIANVTETLPVSGHVLQYNGTNWINGLLSYSNIENTPTLATVATSGSYNDLSNTPALATVATSGSYNDLSNLPTLVVDASDLTDTTNRFFSGAYDDLSGSPLLATVATSGSYNDLSNTPALATVATSGSYNDLSNLPVVPEISSYNISAITNVNGAAVRLNESVSDTNSEVIIVSGNGIDVTRTNDTSITVSSTLTGIPAGVTLTSSSISFVGTNLSNIFATSLIVQNPTANRTLTVPNASGTITIDSTNKTYSINAIDSDSRHFESRLGLRGSNTGADSYTIVAGVNGLRVGIDTVAGGQQSSFINSLTITPPPAVHIGTNPPVWAKNGDLWYDNVTGVLKIFDESLFPAGATVVNYFQAVDQGGSRFFADAIPPVNIPSIGQFVVGPGIPSGANIVSIFNGSGNNVGWFNLNTGVSTNIPHNATLRIYNTNPNVNINNIWRTLYEPIPSNKLLQDRLNITGTTQLLAIDGGQNINLPCPKTFALLKINTDIPAWITIYSSVDARSNDANREYNVAASPNSGVIADITTTALKPTVFLTPGVIGFNENNTDEIYIRVVNKSNNAEEIDYNLTVLSLQA